MVSLYIENQFIELDNTVQFAITKQFEDITNPTSIINDWSKTVSIPFTENNNKTFGNIFNPDRITVYGSNSEFTTGIYFDPLKKLDFKLYWDSALLMSGYAKLNTVTKTNGKGRYNITLNGELGRVFQEMKKITFDETAYTGEDKDKYWIDGSEICSQNIDAYELSKMWETEHIYDEELQKSLINFAPNNAISEGFDYKIFQKGSNSIIDFTEVLNEVKFAEETGVEPDNIISNGMLPREIGEYRSYLQLPYTHFYKLFLIFKRKFESISDYKINLDKLWFNEDNPYWCNLVFMLEMLNISTENQIQNTYDMRLFPITSGYGWEKGSTNKITDPTSVHTFDLLPMQQFSPEEKQPIVNWGVEDKRPFKTTAILSTNKVYQFKLQTPAFYYNGKQETFKLNPANALEINVKNNYISVKPDNSYNGINSYSQKYLICGTDYTGSREGYYKVIEVGEAENTSSYSIFHFDLPIELNLSKLTGNDIYSYISFDANWVNNVGMVYAIGNRQVVTQKTKLYASDQMFDITINEKVKRSGAMFTINDVWNNEYNLFEEILKYCKMFRILISTDEVKKEILFTPSVSFFSDYEILDWTDKLDISKEYSIKPITFENKYVLFNYDDSESNLNKAYREKYGVNFGEFKLTTEYNFNTETKKLFDKMKTGIAYTPYILSWNNLYNNKLVSYSFPNEIYISSTDKDNKQVKLFGAYLFYNGLKEFDTDESLNLRPVHISDDTDYQTAYKTYCYTQNSDTVYRVATYPELGNLYNSYFSTFGTPLHNYTVLDIPEDYKNTYTLFWKDYLDERYNINNKVVTCYLDIKPFDYCNFKFNKFIKIDNQLYFVNKIYDYDITNNSTTKVDLITIQNINGYIENDFNKNFTIFKFYNPNGELYNSRVDYIDLKNAETETWYISSSSDVNWSFINLPTNFSQSELAKISVNGETISGTIQAGIKVPINIKNNGTDLNATMLFKNQQGFSVSVNIRTFFKEMKFFNSTNNVIYEYDMLLENVGQTKTIYMTANTPVGWRDVNSSLSGVQVYYNNNTSTGAYQEGTIPAGTKVPITFKMVDSTTQSGAIEFTNGINSFTVDIQKELNTKFTVYDTDKTEYDTSDKVILQNTSPLTKTIYITSPNTDVSWNDNGTNLQDLYVNGAAGSGTIPKGTLVPVTLTMDVGDGEPKDMPVYGEIKFYTPQKTVIIDIMLIWNEIFELYRWDGKVWEEEFDYIELTQSDSIKTIYLSANDEVEWTDVSGDLQNLYLSTDTDEEDWGNYTRGSGTIYPPSNMKPVHFRMDKQGQQGTDSGKVSFFNGKHEWFVDVVLRG